MIASELLKNSKRNWGNFGMRKIIKVLTKAFFFLLGSLSFSVAIIGLFFDIPSWGGYGMVSLFGSLYILIKLEEEK